MSWVYNRILTAVENRFLPSYINNRVIKINDTVDDFWINIIIQYNEK